MSGQSSDTEQKKVRWERPTMHRYNNNDKDGSGKLTRNTTTPITEQKFFNNALETFQSKMMCAAGQDPTAGTKSVWSTLFESTTNNHNNNNNQQIKSTETGSSSQDHSGSSNSNSNTGTQSTNATLEDESRFKDGPSVIEIGHAPTMSESITVSESMFTSSREFDEDEDEMSEDESNGVIVRRNRHSSKYRDFVRGDSVHHHHHPAHHHHPLIGGEDSRVKSHSQEKYSVPAEHSDMIHAHPDPSESERPVTKKEKIHRSGNPKKNQKSSKSDISQSMTRRSSQLIKKKYNALKSKMKDSKDTSSSKNPPIEAIHVEADSNTVSVLSGIGGREYKMSSIGNIEKKEDRMCDNTIEEDKRSGTHSRLDRHPQIKGVTPSFSSMSLGLKFKNRTSNDSHALPEKENITISPYEYEYNSGVNTYVAYFETCSTTDETKQALQLIEHPNPPLLPFDSNEVVVKIEVRD